MEAVAVDGGEEEADEAGGLVVAGLEVDAGRGEADGDDGASRPGILAWGMATPLSMPLAIRRSRPTTRRSTRAMSIGVSSQATWTRRRIAAKRSGAVRSGVKRSAVRYSVKRTVLPRAEQALDHGAAGDGRHQGHDHQGDEEAVADDAGLQGQQAEDDLHRAAGVHAEARPPRPRGGRTRSTGPPDRQPEHLAERSPGAVMTHDQRQVEVRHEVHPQADRREEQRGEEERDELGQRGARALAEVARVARGRCRR